MHQIDTVVLKAVNNVLPVLLLSAGMVNLSACSLRESQAGKVAAADAASRPVADARICEDTFYEPPPQPDLFGKADSFGDKNWDSDQMFARVYEPLRAKHPDEITRQHIGKDASSRYDMWCYQFAQATYQHTVYLQAGVHGVNELQSYWALARLMHLIYGEDGNTNGHIRTLRHTVRFLVVPIVNVWNVTTKRDNPYNANHVNLNRNWKATPPQQEIVNIKAVLDRYREEIDFGFDIHTDPEGVPGWGGYLLIYPGTIDPSFSDTLKQVNRFLYQKHLPHLKKAYMGDDLHYPRSSKIDVNRDADYPTQDLRSSCASGMWTEFGIAAATLEHGDRKFSALGSSVEMTSAVELVANHIIQQVFRRQKERRGKAHIAQGIP
jgi:hypothetical protein